MWIRSLRRKTCSIAAWRMFLFRVDSGTRRYSRMTAKSCRRLLVTMSRTARPFTQARSTRTAAQSVQIINVTRDTVMRLAMTELHLSVMTPAKNMQERHIRRGTPRALLRVRFSDSENGFEMEQYGERSRR